MTEYRLNQTGAEVQGALDQVPVTQEQLQQEVSVRSEAVGSLDERVGNLEQNSYQKPADGIPKSDLAEGVQTSLNKADSALQSQEQADWNQSNSSEVDYIKNKPNIPDPITVDSSLSDTSTNPVQNKVVKGALDEKQNILVFDSTPRQNSGNPVTSGGVYEALLNAEIEVVYSGDFQGVVGNTTYNDY